MTASSAVSRRALRTGLAWTRCGPGVGRGFVLHLRTGPDLLYCVLWCIIPKARSVSDRVAMKGEPVTVDAIKETSKTNSKGQGEFENPTPHERFRAWWSRFISDHLPRFLKACMRTLGWMHHLICVLILLALGGLILSAMITGQWNFNSCFDGRPVL